MESQPAVSKIKNPNLDNLIKLLESLGKTFKSTSAGYKGKEVTTTTEVAGTTDAALKQIVPIIFDALVAGISTFNQSLEESEHQEDLLAVITDASGKMATPETLNGLFDKINLGPITLETLIQYENILKAFGIKNISETTAGLASINGIPALLAAIQRIDIKDEATARNMKFLATELKTQFENLIKNDDFKKLDDLITPLVEPFLTAYLGKRAAGWAASGLGIILKGGSQKIINYIIAPWVLPLVGLENTGITASTYSELLGKIILHIIGKLEEKIEKEEQIIIKTKTIEDAFNEVFECIDELTEISKRAEDVVTTDQKAAIIKKVEALSVEELSKLPEDKRYEEIKGFIERAIESALEKHLLPEEYQEVLKDLLIPATKLISERRLSGKELEDFKKAIIETVIST